MAIEGHSHGETNVTGSWKESPNHEGKEAEAVEEYMALKEILNEWMYMIIENLDLNSIGEKFYTKFWLKNTNIELVAKNF